MFGQLVFLIISLYLFSTKLIPFSVIILLSLFAEYRTIWKERWRVGNFLSAINLYNVLVIEKSYSLLFRSHHTINSLIFDTKILKFIHIFSKYVKCLVMKILNVPSLKYFFCPKFNQPFYKVRNFYQHALLHFMHIWISRKSYTII